MRNRRELIELQSLLVSIGPLEFSTLCTVYELKSIKLISHDSIFS